MSSETLTAYERRRLDNIRRNNDVFSSLNLHQKSADLSNSLKRPRPRPTNPKPTSPPHPLRRSLRDPSLTVHKERSKPPKPVKDVNKPKRPPSFFLVFMEEFREMYREKYPDQKKVSVIGKAAGEKWKSLSDVEKAPYVTKANVLKAEYETKMIAYNKQVAERNDVEVASAEDGDEEEARSKLKRPPNAFFIFMEEFREKYKEKYPNEKKVSVIGKAGAAKWKSLSDADKAPYVTKANELKAEYERKRIAYNNEVTKGNGDEERSDKNGNAVDDY